MEETSTRNLAEGIDNKNDNPKTSQLKVGRVNSINTTSYIQILGNGMDTQDTSPSILLFFDQQRFIFNAGEGLQRYCTEHKIKFSKIDHIFLSRVCSETAGGLPGLLLTLASLGVEGISVNIWGPSDLQYLVDAMLSFIPSNIVHAHCFGQTPNADTANDSYSEKVTDVLIDNELVKISAILTKPTCPIVCQHKKNSTMLIPPSSAGSNMEWDRHMGHHEPDVRTVLQSRDISVVYVCELPEVKGKFDPAKAKSLGLRPGPKYRELQLGNSVMSDKQDIMVHPGDVLGPSVRGPTVLVVDCPTLCHLQELVSIQSLQCYYSDQRLGAAKYVNCIIHLSPSSVTMNVTYQKWMERFIGAQHIMTGHEIKNMEIPILKASTRVAIQLNHLCPQFFPATGFLSPQPLYVPNADGFSEGSCPEACDRYQGENLLKLRLRPYAKDVDKSEIPKLLVHEDIINEVISEVPEVKDSVEHVRKLWNENKHESHLPSSLENISREDMEIVLLGTGSMKPSQYRNVSSIFLNLFSKGGLLLDCGEGTLGQLKRRYGVKGADDVVRNLTCIWISHIHADHHVGIVRILALRCELLRGIPHEPLLVIGPVQLEKFLNAYQRLEDLDMQFLDCAHTTKDSWSAFQSSLDSSENGSNTSTHFRSLKSLKKVMEEATLEGLVSIPVMHCPHAFGIVVQAADRINTKWKTIPGWKIAYSGDTRPCPELVDAACGATVLIHEATFEDGMLEEAIARNHSTTTEAIQVGDSAKAYRIVLTHFSQRYPKIPVFDDTHMHKTCIGFDLMSINIADLPVLPRVLPYLKLLFKHEIKDDEYEDTVSSLL